MNPARLLRIANRINLLLLRELAQGVDCQRMLVDARYLRDVLLVCDALPGTDLASLAQHFRTASAEPLGEHGQGPAVDGDHNGFEQSVPAADESGAPPAVATSPWFSPSRWLVR